VDECKPLMAGTYAAEVLYTQQADAMKMYQALSGGVCTRAQSLCQRHPGRNQAGSFTKDDLRWAIGVVRSRARGGVENKHLTDVQSPPPLPRGGVTENKHLTDVESPPPLPRGGVTENKHSTDVEFSPPPFPRVCMTILPEGMSSSDRGCSACSERPSCRAVWITRRTTGARFLALVPFLDLMPHHHAAAGEATLVGRCRLTLSNPRLKRLELSACLELSA